MKKDDLKAFISLISAIFFLLASMVMTGCATLSVEYTPDASAGQYINMSEAEKTIQRNKFVKNITSEGILFTGGIVQDQPRGFRNEKFFTYEKLQPQLVRFKDPCFEFYRVNLNDNYLLAGGFSGVFSIEQTDDAKRFVDAIFVLKHAALQRKKINKIAARPIPVEKQVLVKSDVDELPLKQTKPNKNAYAIVIGVENYRQKLPKADYAENDARIMAEYLTKVMGYPEENIVMLINDHAAKSDFEKYLGKWLPNNVEKDSSVFIYYSGHGAPNPKTGDAFLVPYDGDPSFIEETGYPLKRLYAKLDRLQVKEIIVVLDSCFSGAGGRSVLAKGARPLVMNMNKQVFHSDRIAILSASSGSQISSTHDKEGHGLFTYFLLKGLKGNADTNNDGTINIGELYGYISPNVERIARKVYNNEQTPQIIVQNNQLSRQIIFIK